MHYQTLFVNPCNNAGLARLHITASENEATPGVEDSASKMEENENGNSGGNMSHDDPGKQDGSPNDIKINRFVTGPPRGRGFGPRGPRFVLFAETELRW